VQITWERKKLAGREKQSKKFGETTVMLRPPNEKTAEQTMTGLSGHIL